jgi:very-short-patch-repair endonuclease
MATSKVKNDAEDLLEQMLKDAGYDADREYRWHPSRKFRSDFALVQDRILIEIEGSGHRTYSRFLSDIDKYNQATVHGWSLLRCQPKQVAGGYIMDLLEEMLG